MGTDLRENMDILQVVSKMRSKMNFSWGLSPQSLPSPTTIIAVIGEVAGLVLSKSFSAVALLFTDVDARKLAEIIIGLKPTSLVEGEWPVEKCD